MKRKVILFTLLAFAGASIVGPQTRQGRAEANGVVLLGAFFVATKIFMRTVLQDQWLAGDDGQKLSVYRRALDPSDWNYRVYDGDRKNESWAFQHEDEAVTFMKKRAEEKRAAH